MGEFAVGKVASHTEGGLDEYALSELWEWAGPAENDIARQVLFNSGDDDEEEDDEDEDDEDETGEGVTKDTAMTDVAAKDNEPPRLPLATVLTFMSTGAVPKVVDRAKQEQDMQAAMKQMQNQRAAEEMERRIGRG
jgi:mediator of RNA polymerase II transcription subunit 8